MKNPENIRGMSAAITLWMLRGVTLSKAERAQNDRLFLNHIICKSALVICITRISGYARFADPTSPRKRRG